MPDTENYWRCPRGAGHGQTTRIACFLRDCRSRLCFIHPCRVARHCAFAIIRASSRAPVAQLDRVPGYEPGGRGFKSCRARQKIKGLAKASLFCLCPASTGLASDLGPTVTERLDFARISAVHFLGISTVNHRNSATWSPKKLRCLMARSRRVLRRSNPTKLPTRRNP